MGSIGRFLESMAFRDGRQSRQVNAMTVDVEEYFTVQNLDQRLPRDCISCCITCSILPMPRFMLIPSELQESATIGSALMLTMSCRLIRIKKGYIQWNKTTVLLRSYCS